MKIVRLSKTGFAFEGHLEEHLLEHPIHLPKDYYKYPNHWCFRVECLDCNLKCNYCFNKHHFTGEFKIDYDKIEQTPIKTFVYTIGEPGLFINEIKGVIEQYPSYEYRHCVKTNGTFISDDIIEDIYAINTDIKGDLLFYEQYTQTSGFFENALERHLEWLSEIVLSEKEITYTVIPNKNDSDKIKHYVAKWVDKTGATLCINIINNLPLKESVKCALKTSKWFEENYGIKAFLSNFRNFDELVKRFELH